MQPAGWYPDPAGVPGRLRFWDGSAWSRAVTFDPSAPFPTGEPPADLPPRSRPTPGRLPWIAAAVSLVLLVVGGGLLIPRLLDREEPPPPPVTGSPTVSDSTPTGSATSGSGAACVGGNGVAIPKAASYTSTGVTITGRTDWSFRLDKNSWGWLDDQAAWGRLVEPASEGMGAAVVIGGLGGRNGFTDPEASTRIQLECLTTYGFWNDSSVNTWRETGSEPVRIDGMAGWRLTGTFTEKSTRFPTSSVEIIVLDSGVAEKLATVVAFWPTDDKTSAAEVRGVVGSLTRA